MSNDTKEPKSDYTLDEILAEAKIQNTDEKSPAAEESDKQPQKHSAAFSADAIFHNAKKALHMEAAEEHPTDKDRKEERPKKRRWSLFHRKKEEDDYNLEDDIYYGLQLKSLEEYRKEYEETIRLDTKPIREAEAAHERKRRAINEALWGDEAGPHGSDESPEQAEAVSEPAEELKSKPTPEKEPEAPAAAAVSEPQKSTEQSVSVPEKKMQILISDEPEKNVRVESAETKSQAKPVTQVESSERQEWLERIFRQAGLTDDDVFDSIAPEFPETPPHPPTPERPPVPPSVEPGPPLEPERQPPVQEPPVDPVIIPPRAEEKPNSSTESNKPSEETPPSAPTKPEAVEEKISAVLREEPEGTKDTEASLKEDFAAAAPETTSEETAAFAQETASAQREAAEIAAEGAASSSADSSSAATERTDQEETPAPVKEPVSVPQQKKETPLPPAEREPFRREYPRYRSDNLPLHVINLGTFQDALQAEAHFYAPKEPDAPAPIPFHPAKDVSAESPAVSEQTENDEVRENIREFPVMERPKPEKRRFRIFGSDEDPAPAEGPSYDSGDELEDYNSPADAESVLNDLRANVHRLFLRFFVTLFFSLILTGFSIAWEHSSLLPAQLHSVYTEKSFLIIELIFLTASAAFSIPAIQNGLSGLFRLQANSDSAVAVAVLTALAHNVSLLFTGFPAGSRLYSALAGFALFLNAAGKLSMARRILRNFRFVSSPEDKYAVQIYDDYNTAIQMSKFYGADGPKIAYQSKVKFLRHFLKHSFSSDPSDHISQILAPAGFIGSIILLIVTAFLTKSASSAFAAFTVGSCLSVPFGATLSVNLPLARLNRVASRCGGMAVGWDAIDRFTGTDSVLVDAGELFPRGTVVLNGIQTFAGQRIDEAILEATALTSAIGGTLSDLFSQIVKSRSDILPNVEHPIYEEGLGISGKVNDRIILVGNGELLKKHGIEAPSHDYEEKYRRGGKVPVYLASGGELVAMFLVFYRSDRRRAAELRRLENTGISLLVRTLDPNITPELISDCFGLSIHSVTILNEHLGKIYDSLRKQSPESRVTAILATKGRASSMFRMLTACIRQRANIVMGVALQTAGAVLGFALAAFFAACGSLSQLSATALLLFELFWAAAVVFIPRIRKP
ncbi:MAG: hypothetical protein ACFWUD_02615 [Thermocaproicibacter melissae]|jgi:hypothetical protein|uniref:hypothetical protein n=1 Tax=Thermocaproicibacter melissae TaxID=2966552 RepID=UPI0024B1ED82|nr:hypothetical protein [Thermocaproicibacter melissae]WBY63744.1 hypothetical protein NOG13_07170 [Thermocaproicibacter melissae]